MKTLIIAPSWIGDTLIAQPLLTLLAKQGAVIDVLAPPWTAALLKRMPEVNQVIINPFGHGDFAFGARRALGKQLRKEGYQQAFVLPNSWKSALVPFFANIPLRIGYTGEARYGLLNRRHTLDKEVIPLLVARYAQLAAPVGAPLLHDLPNPALQSTPTQQAQARQALGLNQPDAPLVLCPGAEYGPAKRWPVRHYAALARAKATTESPAWILGSPKDAAVAEEIVAAANGCAINLCGKTSLEQAIDLIACARHVVSNDSGLMHVSAALNRPLTALYGSSSPRFTPPLAINAKVLSLNLVCSPCFKRECPLGHLDCLEKLSPDKVIAIMDSTQ